MDQTSQYRSDDPIIQEAISYFDECSSYYGDIRTKSFNCHAFYAGAEKQWKNAVLNSYKQQERPDLTFNQLPQYVNQVCAEHEQNVAEILVSPRANGASEKIATVLEDLVRGIVHGHQGKYAVNHADRQHVIGGLGYFRIETEYVGKTWQQRIFLSPIEAWSSVFFDPSGEFPTYCDAGYCLLFHDMPKRKFREEYGDNTPMGSLAGIDGREGEWISRNAVRILEFIKREKVKHKLLQLRTGQTILDEQVPPQQRELIAPLIQDEREYCDYKVTSYMMTSYRQLRKPQEWVGNYIPIIPICGEKIILEDTEVRIKGLLHDSLEPQQALNFVNNEQLLQIAAASKSPWLVAEGQTENMEAQWKEANKKVFSALKYKRYDESGRDLGQPIRNNTEPPIQATNMAIQALDGAMQKATGIYSNALGDQQTVEESGMAVLARKQQTSKGNSRFTAERNVALVWCGKQLLELIPKVYDAPQVMRLEGLDKNGYDAVVYNSQAGQQAPVQAALIQGIKGVFDLGQGEYDVEVKIGPDGDTQREQCQLFFQSLAQAVPALVPRFADLWARSMDFPEKDTLADRLMPPDIAQQQGNAAAAMPAMQQQLQQAQMAIQKMQGALQQLLQEKQAKITETQGKIALEKVKIAGQHMLEQQEMRKDLAIEELKARQAGASDMFHVEHERLSDMLDRHHEKFMKGQDQAHDHALAQRNHEHEQIMSSMFGQQNNGEEDQNQPQGG